MTVLYIIFEFFSTGKLIKWDKF